MNISADSFSKIVKFFPLKLNLLETLVTLKHSYNVLIARADSFFSTSCEQNANNEIKILYVDSKIDNQTITVRLDGIFVDIDPVDDKSDGWDSLTDGLDLVKHFCSPLFNGVSVFVLTSLNDVSLTDKFKQVGAKNCFMKPFSFSSLKEVLRDNITRVDDSMDASFTSSLSKSHRYSTLNVTNDDNKMTEDANKSNHQKVNKESNGEKRFNHSVVGTVHYIAPEVIQYLKYGKCVDWWAVGVTFYESVVKDHIFNGKNQDDIFDKILNQPINLTLLLRSGEDIYNLVEGLLSRNVNNRFGVYGCDVIKSHNFFRDIDWDTISEEDAIYIPKQFKTKQINKKDKVLFYAEKQKQVDQLPSLNSIKTEQSKRDFSVIKKYQMNIMRFQKSRKGIDRSNIQHTPQYSKSIEVRRKKLISGEESLPSSEIRETKIIKGRSLSFSFSNEVVHK